MSPTKPAVAALHRTTIIDSAKRLFAQNGFEGTTMDDIARAAGYSKRTVYVYVSGKADIQNWIVLAGFTALLEQLRHVANTTDSVVDALQRVTGYLVELYTADRYLFTSMMSFRASENSEADDPVLAELATLDDALDEVVVQLVEDARERGELRPGLDPTRTAFALWAELAGLVTVGLGKQAHVRRRLELAPPEFLTGAVTTLAHSITREVRDA